jgi:hypothetical protein
MWVRDVLELCLCLSPGPMTYPRLPNMCRSPVRFERPPEKNLGLLLAGVFMLGLGVDRLPAHGFLLPEIEK